MFNYNNRLIYVINEYLSKETLSSFENNIALKLHSLQQCIKLVFSDLFKGFWILGSNKL